MASGGAIGFGLLNIPFGIFIADFVNFLFSKSKPKVADPCQKNVQQKNFQENFPNKKQLQNNFPKILGKNEFCISLPK